MRYSKQKIAIDELKTYTVAIFSPKYITIVAAEKVCECYTFEVTFSGKYCKVF